MHVFLPALRRRYGPVTGPYVLQQDYCPSLDKGVKLANAHLGFEALRVIFRGRNERDPVVPGFGVRVGLIKGVALSCFGRSRQSLSSHV